MSAARPLRAPFPYFGGKSKAADIVWPRLGRLNHYVSPFLGSGAMLFENPHTSHETVNDIDGHVCNVWRAIVNAPADVERIATASPLHELDVHARNSALIDSRESLTDQLRADPTFFDARLAAWWIYARAGWFGKNFARRKEHPKPDVGCSGKGVFRARPWPWQALADRLKAVRFLCGDWSRCVTPAVLDGKGATVGVFLDPPYRIHNPDQARIYAADRTVWADVETWARSNGDQYRIALCGQPDDYRLDWSCTDLQGSAPAARKKARIERIWFSPACLPATGPSQTSLFTGAT